MNRPRSQDAFTRACKVIPGGVNSPARAFGGVGGQPIFIARGEGPFLLDIDGNRYLDYVGSWGPLILGHAHPAIVKAAMEAEKQERAEEAKVQGKRGRGRPPKSAASGPASDERD